MVVFFGLVPVMATYYLQAGTVSQPVVLLSLGMGLATDVLLVVNNYRDIDQDKANGKRTVCVWLGKRGSLWLYAALVLAASLLAVSALVMMERPAVIPCTYTTLGLLNLRKLANLPHNPSMNVALGDASRSILFYALVVAAVLLAK